MANDSSSGGYLLGQSPDNNWLRRSIHDFIAGVTGLPLKQVRPMWQPEPPKFNPRAQSWAAFAIISKEVTGSESYERVDDESVRVRFWEAIDFNVQFYGPGALDLCEQFRNGCFITQNREALWLKGMTIKSVKPMLHIPELLNDGWIDRCDSGAIIMRDNTQHYDIKTIAGVDGSLAVEDITTTLRIEQ